MTGTNGTATTVAAAVVLFSVVLAAPLTAASGATTDLPEPGTPGEVSSAEDDEDRVFDLKFTVEIEDNSPGVVDGQHTIMPQGLTENITVHSVGIESEPFDYSNCEPGKTTALGIDRGNDDHGTVTDKSARSSYKQFIYEEGSITPNFFEESTLAGEPVEAYVHDELVAQQGNCIDSPSEPGWYQFSGFINGSSNGNRNTDYRIETFSAYVYICDCADEAAARERLGSPPNEQGQVTPTHTPTATPEPQQTATASATATSEPKRTATPEQGTATATATARPTTSGGGGQAAPADATNQQADLPRTPAVGDGPGFGVAATLLAVLSLFVLMRRKEERLLGFAAEIRFLDLLVVPDLLGGPLGDLRAEVDDDGPVDELEQPTHVVIDDDQRHAVVTELTHQFREPLDLLAGEAGERLVDQQQVGGRRHRTPHLQPDHVGVGERVGQLVHRVAETDPFAQLHRPGLRAATQTGSREQLVRHERYLDVLDDGPVLQRPERLERPCHPARDHLVKRGAGHPLAAIPDLAVGGWVDARDAVERRRLPRPVRADEAEYLLFPDCEREVVHRHEAAEPLGQAVRDEDTVVGTVGPGVAPAGRPVGRARPLAA